MKPSEPAEANDLRGAMTALITPFDSRGRVDVESLDALVRWQVESGIHGIVPCGTTGEGATLDPEEHARVVETVVAASGGRVPVIAGCGSNDTRRTVAAARRAEKAGANALLVVTPYYNKPNRTGMLQHYRAVCEATPLPVVVYNVPGRTGQDIGAALILELAALDGVIGVKEASGDLDRIATLVRDRPEPFAVLSGDDPLALPAVAMGAEGVISVVSNEAPAEMAAMVEAALEGDIVAARRIHYRLLELMRANFVETNPVPVKTAMKILGRCGGELRLPLGAPAEETAGILAGALAAAGLVKEDL
jgi:4-hydroxy-tetrahydrodipicolinate synthase